MSARSGQRRRRAGFARSITERDRRRCTASSRSSAGARIPSLTQEICDYLNVSQGNSTAFNFSDGETFCQIDENVRGSDVFIVQPTCRPVNENLMELLILLDAFKRSSASRVTAVMPYYGYARQDKKDQPRVPITAKLVADLISRAGADRVLTMDLHAAADPGLLRRSGRPLFAAPVLLEAIRELEIPDLVIVSPDAGGVERARAIAKRLAAGLAIVDKRRTAPNVAEIMHIIGDVARQERPDPRRHHRHRRDAHEDRRSAARRRVPSRILAAGVHGVLSGPALQRIEQSPARAGADHQHHAGRGEAPEVLQTQALSVAPLLGEAIRRIHENSSVCSLFV